MPLVVAVAAVHADGCAVVADRKPIIFHPDKKFVVRLHLGRVTDAGGHDGEVAVKVFSRLEPQTQRVALEGGAVLENLGLESHVAVGAHIEGAARGGGPAYAVFHDKGGPLRLVLYLVADALTHGVVVAEVHLVAIERLVGNGYLVGRQRLGPQACLYHAALIG